MPDLRYFHRQLRQQLWRHQAGERLVTLLQRAATKVEQLKRKGSLSPQDNPAMLRVMGLATRLAILVLLASSALTAAGTAAARPTDTRSSVDSHTRTYIQQVRACMTVTSLAISIGSQSKDDIQTASAFRSASQTCDAIRHRLLLVNTDHFDNQASTAWYGVERLKSGLNAFINYIDTRAPSKAAEATDKITEGSAAARAGIAGINARRVAYGLRRI